MFAYRGSLRMTLLAAAGAMIALPAHAGKPGGGGGGQDNNTAPKFSVTVLNDASTSSANLWAPGPDCQGETPDAKTKEIVTLVFFYHQTCATLTSSDGTTLTDDLTIRTTKDDQGRIIAVRVTGQTDISKNGIMHESDEIPVNPPVTPVIGDFQINVRAAEVALYNCNVHVARKNTVCDTPAGTFSIDDVSYVLQPTSSSIESTIRYAPSE